MKHGYARAGANRRPEYRSWRSMIDRCSRHPRYAGRGITVAPEWLGDGGFERFLAHIGHRPGPGYSVERKRNDEGYAPGNVKWATRSEQMSNTCDTIRVTIGDREQCLKRWCEELAMPYKQVNNRVRLGWDPLRALTTPIGPSNEAKAAACR
jgi:hypothetical protein